MSSICQQYEQIFSYGETSTEFYNLFSQVIPL